MSPDFMNIAARRNILFHARLWREDFFDKTKSFAYSEAFFVLRAVPSQGSRAAACSYRSFGTEMS